MPGDDELWVVEEEGEVDGSPVAAMEGKGVCVAGEDALDEAFCQRLLVVLQW